jgi:creatinine amidohydrolase
MHLAEMSSTDADGTVDATLLPVGATEQHGPHAPLGTDTLSAEAVAEAGAEAYGGELVVAPAIPVGVSEEHRDFAGSLWVRPDTLRSYVRDTVASLAHHGFDPVVVVNGHGGNVGPLREVCARLSRDGTYTVPFTWFDTVDLEELGIEAFEMGHGGGMETSLLLSTHPDLVDTDRLEEAAAGAAPRWGEWAAGTNLAYDTAEFSESGVVGDPTAATVEAGETLVEAAADGLAELLAAVVERDGAD